RFGGRVVRSGQQQMQVAAAGGLVDAADDFGEELSMQVGQQHADRVRTPGDEAASRAVGYIPKSCGDSQNAGAGDIGDVAETIDHAGNGRDGYFRLPCHIFDGRHQRPPSIIEAFTWYTYKFV